MTPELLDITFGRIGYPKVVEYTESDTPDRWKSRWNLRKALHTNYYKIQTSKSFTYSLNKQGYRENDWKEINWTNSYIFLGCSHTFGVGVPQEDTLPKQIQNSTDKYCVNLGIPGGNNSFSMFNSSKLINQGIKPLGVFYQRTYANRWFDIKDDNTLDPFLASDNKKNNYFKNKNYIDFLDNSISETIHSQWKNICPIIEFNIAMFPDHDKDFYIARDGCHYNEAYFKKIVPHLLEKLHKYS
jgi:hypothetical protein